MKVEKPRKFVLSDMSHCCGCSACANVCPSHCITMKEDAEGFLIPIIASEHCIGCNLCEQTCPTNHNEKSITQLPKACAVRLVNENERAQSRSGGAFTAFAKYVISKGGAVYGVVLNKSLKAVYERIIVLEELNRLKGSKYVQADVNDIFRLVQSDLIANKKVIFSGTPCHVNGLKQYLCQIQCDFSNLYTVDLVCHGVPSPMLYKDYITFLEKRHASTVTGFNFRNKQKGWESHFESYTISSGVQFFSNDYSSLFYSHLFLRSSCYKCQYTNLNRVSDITIGDFWGIEKVLPELCDNKGVSVVLTNTQKGEYLFNDISDNVLEKYVVDCKDCMQKSFIEPVNKPKHRASAWKLYQNKGFSAIYYKYCVFYKNFFVRVIRKVFRMLGLNI